MVSTTVSLRHAALLNAPLRIGIAFAVTVGVFYTLCMAVWAVAPGPFLAFMNNLFHGLDFSLLARSPSLSWAGFLEALVVLVVWSFLAGTFFGWVRGLLED